MSTRPRTLYHRSVQVPNCSNITRYSRFLQRADAGSDDEAAPSRSAIRGGRTAEAGASKEELDSTNLMQLDEATKKFRKAERRRGLPSISCMFMPLISLKTGHERTMHTRRLPPTPLPQSSRQHRAPSRFRSDCVCCRPRYWLSRPSSLTPPIRCCSRNEKRIVSIRAN
jgi:hypothetical protein